MKYYFCTYFDKNYLARGLALYRSLERTTEDFTLWILCFDDETYALLEKLQLSHAQLIRLTDFEDAQLLQAKKTRSLVEYYWTTTPSLPLYILRKNPTLPHIAYLDADLFFFSSPEDIYREVGDTSVMIIPHGFSENKKKDEKLTGIYNVSMVYFKNDENSHEVLSWWRERCLEWCYDRYEDGKFGDQAYLNDWPTRFRGVHVLKHHGADVSTWNKDRFIFTCKEGRVFLTEKEGGKESSLIFYHFHGLRIYKLLGHIFVWGYGLSRDIKKLIYHPYRQAVQKIFFEIQNVSPSFTEGISVAHLARIAKAWFDMI